MNIVIWSCDVLAAGAIGCFGNEWVETPALDGLAADGVAYDRCLAGRGNRDALAGALTKVAGQFELITEEQSERWAPREAFSAVHVVSGETGLDAKPDRVATAKLVELARKRMGSAPGSGLRLWLHSAGVRRPCEPPTGFATLYVDEFDERGVPAPDVTQPGWQEHPAVYAGAVSLLDHWVGALRDALAAEADRTPTLFVFCAFAGEAWRSVRRRESVPAELDPQRLLVPVLVHPFGDVPVWSELRGDRCRQPTALADLVTLFDGRSDASPWLQGVLQPHAPRTVRAPGVSLTAQWMALRAEEGSVRLYSQPEDRWAVHDLADQRSEVVEGGELKVES